MSKCDESQPAVVTTSPWALGRRAESTWTGSIGVIIPRYNAAELAKRIGVSVEPLTTGRFKDTLSPFRDLTEEERTLWGEIIDDAYQRFVGVIAENRSQLDAESLAPLATGRIFTATQARDSGLIDEIGFLDDCIAALQEQLGLNSVRVVTYYSQPSLLESLVGLSAAQRTSDPLTTLMEASVPRALYLCSWAPLVPATETSED